MKRVPLRIATVLMATALLVLAQAGPTRAAPDQFGLLKARSLGMAGTGIGQINDKHCDPMTLNPASIGATPFHNVSFTYRFGSTSSSTDEVDDYNLHYMGGSGIVALDSASFFAGVSYINGENQRTLNILPGAGVSLLNETLFLGTWFKIWRGFVEVNGSDLKSDFNVSTEAGVIYWPYEPISIGLLFGTNSTDQARRDRRETLVEVPLRFGLGVTSYLLEKKLTMNIDFQWYDYQDIPDLEAEGSVLFGMEYRLPLDEYLGIPLRWGIGYNWYHARSIADRGNIPITLGVGIDTTFLAIDVSYIHIESTGGVDASSNDIMAVFSISF